MNISDHLEDLSLSLGYPRYHNVRYMELQQRMERLQPRSVLVLGCGLGQLESILPRDVRCIGVDMDKERIEKAYSINPKTNRIFYNSNVFDVDMDMKFDVVVISELIEHILDDIGLVERSMEWTKGHMMVTVPNYRRLLNRNNPTIGPEHVREYTVSSFMERIVVPLDLNVIEWGGVFFEIPYQEIIHIVMKPLSRHRITKILDRMFPTSCTWLYFLMEVGG